MNVSVNQRTRLKTIGSVLGSLFKGYLLLANQIVFESVRSNLLANKSRTECCPTHQENVLLYDQTTVAPTTE